MYKRDYIKSIDFLRGIGCLLILFDHLFYPSPHFKTGLCGMGIFFLVSGFVIPISLHRTNSLDFIIHRCFKLYPIAIVSTLAFAIFSKYGIQIWTDWPNIKTPNNPSFSEFIMTVTQVWDLFNIPVFRPIFWSLVIKEKFYWIMALTKLYDKKMSFKRVMFIGIMISLCLFGIAFFMNEYYKTLLFRNATFLSYIYIGVALYYYHQGRVSKQKLRYTLLGTICIFLLILSFSTSGKFLGGDFMKIENTLTIQKSKLIASLSVSLIIFLSIYETKKINYHTIYAKFMHFMAMISYPMYVVHTKIYYKISKLYVFHPPILHSFMYCLACIGVSYILHIMIERPMIKCGYKITALINKSESKDKTLI